jgi:hypothetical protein
MLVIEEITKLLCHILDIEDSLEIIELKAYIFLEGRLNR